MGRRALHAEYFLLAHDGYSGRLHIDQELFEAGVAAALLADLTLTGHIAITRGAIEVGAHTAPPGDPVGAAVLGQLGQGEHRVSRWVKPLAGIVTALVGDDLVRCGVVARAPAGRLKRLSTAGPRHVAVDALAAAAPRVLLRAAADTDGPADRRTTALAAFAVATGLEHVVADGANRTVRDRLRALAGAVDGDLRAIVAGMDEAVAQITLTTKRGH